LRAALSSPAATPVPARWFQFLGKKSAIAMAIRIHIGATGYLNWPVMAGNDL
jgi:hypothetical protein